MFIVTTTSIPPFPTHIHKRKHCAQMHPSRIVIRVRQRRSSSSSTYSLRLAYLSNDEPTNRTSLCALLLSPGTASALLQLVCEMLLCSCTPSIICILWLFVFFCASGIFLGFSVIWRRRLELVRNTNTESHLSCLMHTLNEYECDCTNTLKTEHTHLR